MIKAFKLHINTLIFNNLKLIATTRQANHYSPSALEYAFKEIDFIAFVLFYKQLEKIKAKRTTYHIEYVLKECYPALSPFSMEEIQQYISKFK